MFYLLTILLMALLMATGILVGIGFYGTYRIGGGAMGAAALITSVTGVEIGSIIIFLGSFVFTETDYEIIQTNYLVPYINQPTAPASYALAPITQPGFLPIWLGSIILGVTFIVLGVASIKVREITIHSGAAMAGGILSIIGGALLIVSPYVLMIIFGFVGFVLLFVAMILWSVVFYSLRDL
jgi:hypothetical protein